MVGCTSSSTVPARAIAYLGVLLIVVLYFMAWPIWRAQFLIEIWPTESWNAYLQDAAASWMPIYPAIESLVGNNYPPLSFYGVALIGKLAGVDNLFVGRALSLLALLSIAIEIFAAVRLLAGGRLGAAVGALWYLAIMARNSTIYIGTNDPQLAGLAIMGAGLVYFLSLCRHERSPTPALLLMLVAGFWKHNNIAIPLASIAWLFIDRNRYAYRATFAAAAAATLGLAGCISVLGPAFLPNLLANRNYAWSNVMGNIGHLQWSALAFLIWATWAVYDRRSKAAQFTALYIGLGLFACVLQWLGHGVSGNAEFDFILALGVGIGVTFTRIEASWLARRIGPERCRDLIVAALLIRLLAADRQETALLLLSEKFRGSLYANQNNLVREARLVANIPGDVACAIKLVCRHAGKAFTVDEFKTEEMIATGKATPAQVSEMLAARQITSFLGSLPAEAVISTSISAWLSSVR